MKEAHLYKLLISPLSTEKTEILAENNNQFVFKVVKSATKLQIKKIIAELFKVEVTKVNIINVKPKKKKFKQKFGTLKAWKKAIVFLADGQDINFANFE